MDSPITGHTDMCTITGMGFVHSSRCGGNISSLFFITYEQSTFLPIDTQNNLNYKKLKFGLVANWNCLVMELN